MKVEEASTKICPYINKECITTKCMMWDITTHGKKKVDSVEEPYDMTPEDLTFWYRDMLRDGYEQECDPQGFRPIYVRYEYVNEGICLIREHNPQVSIKQ